MKTFSVRRLETVKTTAALYGFSCPFTPSLNLDTPFQ
jgi:hypothetical protein